MGKDFPCKCGHRLGVHAFTTCDDCYYLSTTQWKEIHAYGKSEIKCLFSYTHNYHPDNLKYLELMSEKRS